MTTTTQTARDPRNYADLLEMYDQEVVGALMKKNGVMKCGTCGGYGYFYSAGPHPKHCRRCRGRGFHEVITRTRRED